MCAVLICTIDHASCMCTECSLAWPDPFRACRRLSIRDYIVARRACAKRVWPREISYRYRRIVSHGQTDLLHIYAYRCLSDKRRTIDHVIFALGDKFDSYLYTGDRDSMCMHACMLNKNPGCKKCNAKHAEAALIVGIASSIVTCDKNLTSVDLSLEKSF